MGKGERGGIGAVMGGWKGESRGGINLRLLDLAIGGRATEGVEREDRYAIRRRIG